jgi:hypothetical protein
MFMTPKAAEEGSDFLGDQRSHLALDDSIEASGGDDPIPGRGRLPVVSWIRARTPVSAFSEFPMGKEQQALRSR